MFVERPPNFQFTGLAWLFMGVANSDAKLYDDEFQAVLAKYPEQFRLDYALSREQANTRGGKMYIQARGARKCGANEGKGLLCCRGRASRGPRGRGSRLLEGKDCACHVTYDLFILFQMRPPPLTLAFPYPGPPSPFFSPRAGQGGGVL